LLRDVLEKGAGAMNAIVRAPGALLSGLLIGGYQGARKGADADFSIKPESVALAVVVSNAILSLAKGAIAGYLLLGPAGAMATGLKEAGESSIDLYLFVKGGSAKVVGQDMTAALNEKVEGGEGALSGGFTGAVAGATSGTRAGLKTGYQEGQAAASGIIEGLKEIPKEFEGAGELKGPFWKRALSVASGVLTAAFAAPAGLALALLKGSKGDKAVSPSARYGAAAASGALAGGAAGSFLGPVGIVVGAGLGALAGLIGPTSRKGFEAKLSSSLRRASADDSDMGSEVGNNRRDLLQRLVTGTVSGTRQGWDAGKVLLGS
jgi:hypothetical protein